MSLLSYVQWIIGATVVFVVIVILRNENINTDKIVWSMIGLFLFVLI